MQAVSHLTDGETAAVLRRCFHMGGRPFLRFAESRFRHATGLTAVFGIEVEFYLDPAPLTKSPETICHGIEGALKGGGVPVQAVKPEQGKGQYEFTLAPSQALSRLADHADQARTAIHHWAGDGRQARFEGKPWADRPGSALHLHLNLLDAGGKPIFTRDGDEYNAPLRHVLGGLVAALPESVPFFVPNADGHARFGTHFMAPTTASWGANNRTAAIRMPYAEDQALRIEHRVAGADAEVAPAMAAILLAAAHGLQHELEPPEKLYGNAGTSSDRSPRLPRNREEAIAMFREGRILFPLCQAFGEIAHL